MVRVTLQEIVLLPLPRQRTEAVKARGEVSRRYVMRFLKMPKQTRHVIQAESQQQINAQEDFQEFRSTGGDLPIPIDT